MTATASGASALLGLYARVGPVFTGGEGVELIADDGTRYLDFTSGIAVNALGYGHPVIREAMTRALDAGLIHVSNLFRTEPGEALAAELVGRSFADQVFFCNSGAEANEGAFKFARKWSKRTGIVAFSHSFHGRLFASLAATDHPEYQKPFLPLTPGVRILPLGDSAAAESGITAQDTAAVIIEPVQGEGGVRPVSDEWLAFLRRLCDERGVALIFDEVQCGLGRTGTLFAYEQTGVTPDMLTLAKPLAGGLPMGAVLVTGTIAAALATGEHATTFGGGPLVASVALEVVKTLADADFLASVRARGEHLRAGLERIARTAPTSSKIKNIRGRGLMWGVELTGPAAPVVTAARERYLLILSAGPNVLRLLPPLVIEDADIDRGLAVLTEVLA